MARKKNGGPPIYDAYRFRGKDPSIDEARTLVETHFGRRVNRKDLNSIKEAGGPPSGTTSNWFFGATYRPQNATIEALGRALGYKRKWVKM